MSLTDQQLRQELLNYGDSVPPITQNNRQQLRARLDFLRSRPRSSPTSSLSRSNATPRSRPVRGLIELSDSETDTSTNEYLSSRSNERETTIQTRSTKIKSDNNQSNRSPLSNVTVDVEQSIARHRREIQQLIDSARDRARAANANIAAGKYEQLPTKPSLTTVRSTISSHITPTVKTNIKSTEKKRSWLTNSQQSIRLFWNTNRQTIVNQFKALLIGLLVAIALILIKNNLNRIIPQAKKITCAPQIAIDCDDMASIINSLRKFLKTRTGEVDCGFRSKNEIYVSKLEINKFLDRKGYIFELGSEERWKTIITYILEKPVDDILIFDRTDTKLVHDANLAFKLKSVDGIHPFICRARRTINSAMQHLAWIVLGTIGFLLIGSIIRFRMNQNAQNEKTYKEFIDKIIDLLQNQYEEHLLDTEVKPWLAVSHIHDMLIQPQDRKRFKNLWERAKKQINERESRIRAEAQLIHGEEFEVWRWIQPRSSTSPSPTRKQHQETAKSPIDNSYVYMSPDIGLTPCLKLRNFFDSNVIADDDEIDLVVDSVQNRCATIKRIEHIGIHSAFVYLKFSSKQAAAQGFHLLNNWKYHEREIIAKYLRLERYYEHFPEARDSNTINN